MINKKIMIPVLAVALLSVGTVLVTTQAQAQGPENSTSGLVKAIAQKFGLEESQVQSVVNEYRTQHKQDMQLKMHDKLADRLEKLVNQGKLTPEQKQAILDKHAELRSEHSKEMLKDLTPEQRKEHFQKVHEELKAWAVSQGIDPAVLPMGKVKIMHKNW